jgi:uncharacterized membrane protein
MRITRTELVCIGILCVTLGISIYFYHQLPDRIAVQWDIHGHTSSAEPKSIQIFLGPAILSVLVIALIVIPRTASVSVNIEGFKRLYGGFAVLASILMLIVQYYIILWNLGIKVNPNLTVIPATSAIIVWMSVWFYRARRKKY